MVFRDLEQLKFSKIKVKSRKSKINSYLANSSLHSFNLYMVLYKLCKLFFLLTKKHFKKEINAHILFDSIRRPDLKIELSVKSIITDFDSKYDLTVQTPDD